MDAKEAILSRVGQWTLRRYDYPSIPQSIPYYSFGTDVQFNNKCWGVGVNQTGTRDDVMDTLRQWTILDSGGEARKMEDTFLSVLASEHVRSVPPEKLAYFSRKNQMSSAVAEERFAKFYGENTAAIFAARMSSIYDVLYNDVYGGTVVFLDPAAFSKAVDAFDQFVAAYPYFVTAINEARCDIVCFDREAAAFMFTYAEILGCHPITGVDWQPVTLSQVTERVRSTQLSSQIETSKLEQAEDELER